jgi:SPP1 family predicted phage head-tail adaptor
MTQAGALDQRIELKRKTRTPDGSGGATTTTPTYATVWANVRPMTGRERERSQRAEASSDYVITIRNRADMLESDLITWRGRTLNIRFIKNQGPRFAFLEIEAELGAAA